ncbi:MAG: SH3 domain-containing protein [Gemmatimonadaceae bacterium]
MRLLLVIVPALLTSTAAAQQTDLHTATRATVVRPAPVTSPNAAASLGQIASGAQVEVLARERDWVRIRLEGWVREADLIVADSSLRPLSAADIRSDPNGSRGKVVRWEVEAVALQTADPLRAGLDAGEPYLLALGPGAEKALVYIAVPPTLLAAARSLAPMSPITITARIRNGRSEPAGVAILDLQSLTRR